MSDSTIAQIFTLVTLVVGFAWQAYRDRQARRWQVEDRQQSAKTAETVQTTADELKKLATTFDDLSPEERRAAREFRIQQDILRRSLAADDTDKG